MKITKKRVDLRKELMQRMVIRIVSNHTDGILISNK